MAVEPVPSLLWLNKGDSLPAQSTINSTSENEVAGNIRLYSDILEETREQYIFIPNIDSVLDIVPDPVSVPDKDCGQDTIVDGPILQMPKLAYLNEISRNMRYRNLKPSQKAEESSDKTM